MQEALGLEKRDALIGPNTKAMLNRSCGITLNTTTTQRPTTTTVATNTTTNSGRGTQLCPVNQLLTQNLKTGARNGQYHPYTQAIVTQADILQGHLNRLGFGIIKEDGILGPNSTNSIKALQRSLNTKADGIVGPLTRAKINYSCE